MVQTLIKQLATLPHSTKDMTFSVYHFIIVEQLEKGNHLIS
jgi:hypothetical protein